MRDSDGNSADDGPFEDLLRASSEAAFVIDSDGVYRRVIEGHKARPNLYRGIGDLVGQRLHDVLPGPTADRFLATIRDVLADDAPDQVEYDLAVGDERHWYVASVTPLPWSTESPESVVWAVTDVTDRVRRERAITALHEVAARLSSCESIEVACEEAIEAAESILSFDLCVAAVETDGMLEVVAASNEIPEGATRRFRVGEGIAGRTVETGETIVVDDLWVDQGDQNPPFRSILSLPVGRRGNFQAVAEEPAAFDAVDRELAELLVAQLDAAFERLHHESQLRLQNERLTEFANIVSHDLRNPLNVAQGNLELHRETCDDEQLERVAHAHDRMEALIKDLLGLAIHAKGAMKLEPVDLPQLVEACWESVDTADATLHVETERTISAATGQLRQLFENLFRNAVEHGGANVTVRVGDVDGGIYIEDDGSGIPDTVQPHVLEVGYTTTEQGTGFGLHIVKRVAESHGWDLTVARAETGGARFVLTGLDEEATT